MLEGERRQLILRLVEERSIVSIAEFAELLAASEATIRRDINALAESGELRRIRGGAEAMRPRHQAHLVGTPFRLAAGVRVPQKQAIARAAAKLVQPGASLIINGGTTTYRLVEFIREMDIDVLTNSFPIAAVLVTSGRPRVTLPGGTVYREQNIILSPFDNDLIGNFWATRLFTGIYGINRVGLMEADPLIVQAEQKLLRQAEQLVVLADSSKLRQQSAMLVAPLSRVSVLITDDGATEEELAPLRDAGVQIIVAPVEPADARLGEVA
jgi:DeoR family transcriptional regulator, ulaG and ulaABCDEF operon transcriptional repressor